MSALAFVGLARLLFALSVPQSPPPTPTPSVKAEENQHISSTKAPDSNPTEQTVFRPAESNDSTNRQHNKSSSDPAPDWVTPLTAVIAFAAFVQVIVTVFQALYMRQGLRQARLEQRAWVAATNITCAIPQVGNRFAARVVVKNTGKTFARNLKVSCFSRLIPQGDPMPDFHRMVETEEAAAETRSVGVLAPNAEYAGGVGGQGTVTQPSADRFNAGEIIYIFGRIAYDDVFGCSHWTTFCSILKHDGSVTVCEKYNNADNNRA